MCGITGIISSSGQIAHPLAILPMAEAIQHRGPEAIGHYLSPDGKLVFGHRRLSIVGLDDRSTVMSIPKKNKSGKEISIVFNGEIYNFRELKRYFKKRGYTSVSPSDFEVIIFAWQEWGVKSVEKLIGEFVYVLYDEETKEVFITRDRTGVKPLFYAYTGTGEFVFGSEPKSILAYPTINKTIDATSIAEFLLMTHTFAAGIQNERSSYFKDIKQFPPAHYALLEKGKLSLHRYWDVPISDRENRSGNIQKVRKAVSRSVAMRVPDEVPVSIGLSGGLDSSIVAALVARDHKAKKPLAVSLRYSNDANEDYKHARILAKKYHLPLTGPIVSPQGMMRLIDRCIRSVDGPVDSIRRMGMHANYEAIRKAGYKVALIGEGADEFNLGYYHTFPGLKRDRDICNSAAHLKKMFLRRAQYVGQFFTPAFKKKWNFEAIIDDILDVNYRQCKSKNPLKRMQYFYAKKFLLYLQDGNDRAAAGVAVEARLPFVDPEVIRVCLAVPQDQNITSSGEKQVLRKAFKDVLPKEIYTRAKSPFPANEDLRLHKLISKRFAREIEKAPAVVWRILDKKFILTLQQRFDREITSIEQKYGKNNGGQLLTSWLPIREPVTLRTNQIFSVLTLIRWISLYKISI